MQRLQDSKVRYSSDKKCFCSKYHLSGYLPTYLDSTFTFDWYIWGPIEQRQVLDSQALESVGIQAVNWMDLIQITGTVEDQLERIADVNRPRNICNLWAALARKIVSSLCAEFRIYGTLSTVRRNYIFGKYLMIMCFWIRAEKSDFWKSI